MLVGRSVSKYPICLCPGEARDSMMACRRRPERTLLEEAHSSAGPDFSEPAIGSASAPEGIGDEIEEPRNSLVFTA